MNQPLQDRPLAPARRLRQQKLEFARSRRWQRLPNSAQQACRQVLANLLCQVMSTIHEGPSRQENDDER
jgi:hypothetical protein